MPPTVEDRFLRIVSNHIYTPIDEIDMKDHFMNDLNFDSLDFVELVMVTEEEFGIEIPDIEAEKICTVEEAIEYIKLKSTEKTK